MEVFASAGHEFGGKEVLAHGFPSLENCLESHEWNYETSRLTGHIRNPFYWLCDKYAQDVASQQSIYDPINWLHFVMSASAAPFSKDIDS